MKIEREKKIKKQMKRTQKTLVRRVADWQSPLEEHLEKEQKFRGLRKVLSVLRADIHLATPLKQLDHHRFVWIVPTSQEHCLCKPPGLCKRDVSEWQICEQRATAARLSP